MRLALLFWVLLFSLGTLVGDRYGLPGMATSITDRGFEFAESWFKGFSGSLPPTENEADPSNSTDQTANPENPSQPSSPRPASADLDHDANAWLHINDAGLKIIQDSESLRLDAYSAEGKWYIGYGHNRTAHEGMTITQTVAEKLLREDVLDAEDGVKRLVLVPVNENQFSAMVSLTYNLGTGGFSRTTVLEQINQGHYQAAGEAFLNHDRARINGTLQPIAHLTERREKERALFLSPA